MNKKSFAIVLSVVFGICSVPFIVGSAEPRNEQHNDHEKDNHDENAEGHNGEHGDDEGENSSVGREKGITEASEVDGFKLSPEAFKNFGVTSTPVQVGTAMTLPRKAIFAGLEERNLYRVRNGFFKRIDFVTVSKSASAFVVRITDAQAGDQIVTNGVGFLRIAELAAFGGVSEGHSH